VGRCYVAAARRHGWDVPLAERGIDATFEMFPWFARYASDACASLRRGGRGTIGGYGPTDKPRPGDVVALSPDYVKPGHIGIYLGGGKFAENTVSHRGPGTPGTGISDLADVQDHFQFFASVFPSSSGLHDLMVVGLDGKPVACHVAEESGVSRVDLAPVAKALGFTATYVVHDDGRRRIYLKPSK
jgi:hypothetical protein